MSFSDNALLYSTSMTHASGPDLDLLLAWACPSPGDRALDVATGGGHVALGLARRGADVTALDDSPEMLEAASALAASEGHRVRTVRGDACAMPFGDAEFDIVTCRIAAHHFRLPEAFFREVHRVLAPGGRLVFQDHALPDCVAAGPFVDSFERLRDPSHVRARTTPGWIALASGAGLAVEDHTVVDKAHDFAEWCARQGCGEEAVEALTAYARRLPRAAAEWLAPAWIGGDDPDVPLSRQERTLSGFRNRHVVLVATKPSSLALA